MFNEYWKVKAAKRRKAWAAVAKRFANEHAQIKRIREHVFLPLDYGGNFSFEGYKPAHYAQRNPIACWRELNFCFSEKELRSALESEGADMNNFKMEVTHQSIKGMEAPQPENRLPGSH